MHHAVPQCARRAQFGNLHEEVHADAKEERKAPGKRIDVQPCRHRPLHIFLAVSDGEGELLHRCRPGFVHVIATDRNRVEFRHFGRGITDDVRHNPHARLRRIDVSVPDHEFLQDVVLDRARKLFRRDTLTLACNDIKRQHRDHSSVHRHADAHRVERDLIEQDFHVLDGVDRNARLTDIANNARVIGIIATVCRQIECNRKTLLPGG